jgi:hypothetical protein
VSKDEKDIPIPVLPVLNLEEVSFEGIRKTNKMVYSTLVGMAIHKSHGKTTGHYTALVKHENMYQIIDDTNADSPRNVITEESIQEKTFKYNTKSSFCVYE